MYSVLSKKFAPDVTLQTLQMVVLSLGMWSRFGLYLQRLFREPQSRSKYSWRAMGLRNGKCIRRLLT